ncbi:MAG: hypothetical protein D3923_14370, partial [Candidatus Electrothrix sp. AR3]|nr:hypothetical protein [Candidatus Electrothrix sp. AR3]
MTEEQKKNEQEKSSDFGLIPVKAQGGALSKSPPPHRSQSHTATAQPAKRRARDRTRRAGNRTRSSS